MCEESICCQPSRSKVAPSCQTLKTASSCRTLLSCVDLAKQVIWVYQ